MKTTSLTYLKLIIGDRLFAALLLLFIFGCIGYIVLVATALRPNELQVAVHYTAFGETSFYRDKWYYFVNFILFGVILAIANSTLAIKLFAQGRRPIALLFVWLSLLLIAIAGCITWALLKVAFL